MEHQYKIIMEREIMEHQYKINMERGIMEHQFKNSLELSSSIKIYVWHDRNLLVKRFFHFKNLQV